jgi:ADP-ribose pyrophosphatase YjhB (NUDIX family)
MLKIKPPNYQFCPFCGRKLEDRVEEQKRRKYCASCRWTYYPKEGASAGAVIVRGGKVLMVKRSREPYKDTWCFPAGFTDFGEHPLEALAREVKEETGLKVKKAEFIDVLQATDDPRNPGHFVFFYRVQASGKSLKTDKMENSAVQWKEIKRPPKLGWKSHQSIFRLLQKELK